MELLLAIELELVLTLAEEQISDHTSVISTHRSVKSALYSNYSQKTKIRPGLSSSPAITATNTNIFIST